MKRLRIGGDVSGSDTDTDSGTEMDKLMTKVGNTGNPYLAKMTKPAAKPKADKNKKSRQPPKRKESSLITLNLDLGKAGYYLLQGLDTDDPKALASNFIRKNGIQPKLAPQIEKMIKEKINQFKQYSSFY